MKTINPNVQIFTTQEKAKKYFDANPHEFLLSASTGTRSRPETSYFVSKTDLRKEWPALYALIEQK